MQKTSDGILVGDAAEMEKDWFSKSELFKEGERFTLIERSYRLDPSSGHTSYLEMKEQERSSHFKLESDKRTNLSPKEAFEWVIDNDHRFKAKTRSEMKSCFDEQIITSYFKSEDQDLLALMNSADRIIVGVNDNDTEKVRSKELTPSNSITL